MCLAGIATVLPDRTTNRGGRSAEAVSQDIGIDRSRHTHYNSLFMKKDEQHKCTRAPEYSNSWLVGSDYNGHNAHATRVGIEKREPANPP